MQTFTQEGSEIYSLWGRHLKKVLNGKFSLPPVFHELTMIKEEDEAERLIVMPKIRKGLLQQTRVSPGL
jgi:hypothetical protein